MLRPIRLNGPALSPPTRSLARVCVNATYARGLRTKATSGTAEEDCWLNIRRLSRSTAPIIYYSTAIGHASVTRAAACRYPDRFWSLARVQDPFLSGSVFNADEVRGTCEINSKRINGSPYLWSCFCWRTQLKLVLIWHGLNRSCDLIRYVIFAIAI